STEARPLNASDLEAVIQCVVLSTACIGGSGLLGGLGLGGARTTTGANGTAGSGNQGVQINVGLQNGSVKGAGTGSSSASEADSGTINSYDLVLGPLSYEELDTNYILAPEFVTLEKEGF
uniref:Uncharacterized protein n=1 Tax=Lutzomyia longipalpis TaxID=7200 RepID=A0A1B0EUX0_LUTLO